MIDRNLRDHVRSEIDAIAPDQGDLATVMRRGRRRRLTRYTFQTFGITAAVGLIGVAGLVGLRGGQPDEGTPTSVVPETTLAPEVTMPPDQDAVTAIALTMQPGDGSGATAERLVQFVGPPVIDGSAEHLGWIETNGGRFDIVSLRSSPGDPYFPNDSVACRGVVNETSGFSLAKCDTDDGEAEQQSGYLVDSDSYSVFVEIPPLATGVRILTINGQTIEVDSADTGFVFVRWELAWGPPESLAFVDDSGQSIQGTDYSGPVFAEAASPTEPMMCGNELPFTPIGATDFVGPFEGASPDAAEPAEQGQLVVHWTVPEGSVELRWPPNTEYTTDVEVRGPTQSDITTAVTWGQGTRSGSQTPTLFLAAFPTKISDGTLAPLVFVPYSTLPAIDMEGPCDAVQLDGYVSSPRPGEGPAKAVVQTLELPAAENSDELSVVLDWRRPTLRELVLIVESLNIDTPPPVLDCETHPPDRTRTVVDGPTFDTPRQALEALLATNEAFLWPRTGYFELIEPDGSITYGRPLEDGTLEGPRPEDGLAIAVAVEQTNRGWTVTNWSWTLSDC